MRIIFAIRFFMMEQRILAHYVYALFLQLFLLFIMPVKGFSDHKFSFTSKCPEKCRCNATSLGTVTITNCSYSDLKEVPEYISPTTRELYLNGNKIALLGTYVFEDLVHLELLDLSDNIITSLKNYTFSGLTSLHTISIAYNKLYAHDAYSQGVFRPCNNLVNLYIQGNCNSSISNCSYPDEVLRDIPRLKVLYLDGYESQILGPGFRKLSNLSVVNFSGYEGFCTFREISKRTFLELSLSKVSVFNLEKCDIIKIQPGTFSIFKELTSLYLDDNPSLCVDGLINATVGLDMTKIKTLSVKSICGGQTIKLNKHVLYHLSTTSLTKLILEGNRIEFIDPSNIADLPKSLQYLSVKGNYISDPYFLRELKYLINLEYFDTSYQYFYTSASNERDKSQKAMPIFTSGIRKVTHHLGQNLTHGSTCGNQTRKLFQAEIKWSKWDQPIVMPPKLKFVFASHLKLGYAIPSIIFAPNNSVQHLDLSYNMFKSMLGTLYGLHELIFLNFSYNAFAYIHPDSFLDTRSLSTLILGSNKLGASLLTSNQDRLFSKLQFLEHLDMSDNDIRDLPKNMLTSQRHLKTLLLSRNSMTNINYVVETMKSLKFLDISFNQITSFNAESRNQLDKISESSNLSLHLDGNPLVCRCDNQDFIDWLTKTKVNFVGIEQLACEAENGSHIRLGRLNGYKDQLWYKCSSTVVVVSCVVGFSLLTLVLIILAVVCHKSAQLRYLYYISKSRVTPYHVLLEADVQMDYDVYISFDDSVSEMAKRLYHCLQQKGFHTIIREELEANKLSYEVITKALQKSRKMLVILTEEHRLDPWNIYEFNVAMLEGIYTKREMVVMAQYGDVRDHILHPEVAKFRHANRVLHYPKNGNERLFFDCIEEKLK